MLVYAVWFGFVEPKVVPRPPLAATSGAPAVAGAPGAPASSAASAPAPIGERPETLSALTLGPDRIELSNRGGGIAHFQFKGPLGMVELIPDAHNSFLATPEASGVEVKDIRPASADFEGTLPGGARLRKSFSFGESRGWNALTVEVSNPGKTPLSVEPVPLVVGPGLGTVASEQKENAAQTRVVAHDAKHPRAVKVKPGNDPGDWSWIGVDNRYFLIAIRRPDPSVRAEVRTPPGGSSRTPPQLVVYTPSATLAPGETRRWAFPFYMGPKAYDHLKELSYGLEHSVNFGFFASIGKFIFFALKKIHDVTGNYGWAVLILTLSIQLVLFPLSLKSLKANAALKKLQPQVQRIQERFKDDPQRMNVEMMQLYKSSGTNPLGGCLPLIAQIPVFFALFTALRNTWELHGAPWIFWIKDLSAHDPYYVLPILMGGLMLLQQKMGPAPAGDPSQARMMQLMPVLFTFMFFNFPAGLVLYWMTNSAVSITTQLAFRRQLEG